MRETTDCLRRLIDGLEITQGGEIKMMELSLVELILVGLLLLKLTIDWNFERSDGTKFRFKVTIDARKSDQRTNDRTFQEADK